MEEIIRETCIDPDIIIGRVHRQMDNLVISNQEASSSRRNKDQKTCHTKNQGVVGGFFKGTIPNVKNGPTAA
jgi:hypothetical protein